MKKTIITSSIVVSMMITAIISEAKNPADDGFGSTAATLISSLQQSCTDKYVDLLPSLKEMRHRAKHISKNYGLNHKEANQAYSNSYTQDLVIVKNSFDALVEEGKKNGIDWSNAQFLSYEYAPSVDKQDVGTFSILVSADNHRFTIRVEKAIVIDGQLRVSHHISLIN